MSGKAQSAPSGPAASAGGAKRLSDDRLRAELDAQRKRAQALKYLRKEGLQDSEIFTANSSAESLAATRKRMESLVRDNTLDLVMKDRAAEAVGLKEALLRQQQELRGELQQQQDKREQQPSDAEGAADAEGGGGGGEEGAAAEDAPPPLPPDFQEVRDEASGRVYYWNTRTNECLWERPAPPVPAEAAPAAAPAPPPLPPGWEEVTHAPTGQVFFVHTTTREKRWTRPTTASSPSDIPAPAPKRALPAAAADAAQGGEGKKKAKRGNEVDPLDPTGGRGGKWSDGLNHLGERMADSTASGSLWQQRPLPAPGQVLRGKTKPR